MVKTYLPDEVTIIFGGAILTGFADGTFVSVSRESDTWSEVVGANGEVARTRTNDKRGTVEITLLQSSASNDVLSAFALADEATGKGALPLLVKDASGRSLIASDSAWIQKMPDVEFGKEIAERKWTIRCASLQVFVGGN